MTKDAPNRPLELSQKLYRRLLAAYPRTHREEYGGAMIQLFRDQCRDAWTDGRVWGLAALWFRTLPDLVKTSFIERCSSFNPGKFMADKLNTFLQPHHSPWLAFCGAFTTVFVVVFGVMVVITLLMPKSYVSRAQIIVSIPLREYQGNLVAGPSYIKNIMEAAQTPPVLGNVVDRLNLNKVWGRKYYGGEPLHKTETIEMLRRHLVLSVIPKTTIILVNAYSEDRNEAAQLANAVAESCQTRYKLDPAHSYSVSIYEHAYPALLPVRPNRPLNLLLGGLAGVVFGVVAGSIGAYIARRKGDRKRALGPA